MDIEPNQPPNYNSNQNREPIFNNMSIGVFSILLVILANQLIRSIFANNYIDNLVFESAVIPARFFDEISMNAPFYKIIWPLIGYQFLHGGWFHAIMNSAMLLQAGPICEIGLMKGANILNYSTLSHQNDMKNRKLIAAVAFILFFLICGILSAYFFMISSSQKNSMLVGASGSISGIFGGFLIAAYNMAKGREGFLKSVLASGFVFLLINVFGAYLAQATGFIPIAWQAHFYGFVAGLILYPIIRPVALYFQK